METYINGAILDDFFSRQPQPIPFGTEDENELWNSFWNYLKRETNLYIDNPDQLSSLFSIFLNSLTTGRGDTNILISEKPQYNCHNNKIKGKFPQTFYCINPNTEKVKKNLYSKNGYLIGFLENYSDKWSDLKLIKKQTSFTVHEKILYPKFENWEQLSDYLIPFTDAIIIDGYILSDDSLIQSNLEKILIQLDNATPVKYNLTIITYEGDRNKLNAKKLFEKLSQIKEKNKLKCNIGLAITTRKVKIHDREIITNYLRIKSGDSFNYFDTKNQVITKGTEISFHSLADPHESQVVRAALDNIASVIKYLEDNFNDSHVFGNLKNRLLE